MHLIILPFTVFEEQCLVQILYKLSEKMKKVEKAKNNDNDILTGQL